MQGLIQCWLWLPNHQRCFANLQRKVRMPRQMKYLAFKKLKNIASYNQNMGYCNILCFKYFQSMSNLFLGARGLSAQVLVGGTASKSLKEVGLNISKAPEKYITQSSRNVVILVDSVSSTTCVFHEHSSDHIGTNFLFAFSKYFILKNIHQVQKQYQ